MKRPLHTRVFSVCIVLERVIDVDATRTLRNRRVRTAGFSVA